MANKKRAQKKKKSKVLPAMLAVLGITIFVVYLVFAIYFHKHFYFGTKLGDLNVGGMTSEEAKAAVEGEAQDYLLTVYDRAGTKYHILGKDVDYSYTSTGEENSYLKQQNSFLWFVNAFRDHNYEMSRSITYKEDMLRAEVSKLDCLKPENMTAPTSAYLAENETGYTIVPETIGSTLIEENVYQAVKEAADNGAIELTLSDQCYVKPEVLSTDETLNTCLSSIDKYLATTITYDIGENIEILDSATIKGWIMLDENNQVSINEEGVASYVQSLASKYNTYGDVRRFTTSNGDVIEIGGGDYGWVVDKNTEKEKIVADLENGTVETREPAYSQTAISRDENDIGSTYIEIDYTSQHLWYYKDGSLVIDTPIVSGNINRNNGSPDGVYKIVYKSSPAVLKGEDYESNVTYFMPFAYNVGIHDASWRNASEFGGSTYKTSGSHGCINVSESAATKLYSTVETNTPVVAYYRESVTLTAENTRISNAYSYVKKDSTENSGS